MNNYFDSTGLDAYLDRYILTPVLMLPVKSLVQEPVPHGFGTHRFWVGDTVCKRYIRAYREEKTVPITRNDGKMGFVPRYAFVNRLQMNSRFSDH